MKKLGLLLLPLLAIALMLGGNCFAQNVGDNSVYFVIYYSNANTKGAPDTVVRVINDGDQATTGAQKSENGNLWAAFYVFDDGQEFEACCACQVSADGLLSESVNQQLTAVDFSARAETSRGVIKLISSSSNDPTNPVPSPGLRGWATHVQATTNIPEKGPFYVSETKLADANLGKIEEADLGMLCSFGLTLSGGYINCPCTSEGRDF
jgi:hypothetical protein